MSQTNDRRKTLGRFTLLSSEDSSDELQNGSFWRKRQGVIREPYSQTSDSGFETNNNRNQQIEEQNENVENSPPRFELSPVPSFLSQYSVRPSTVGGSVIRNNNNKINDDNNYMLGSISKTRPSDRNLASSQQTQLSEISSLGLSSTQSYSQTGNQFEYHENDTHESMEVPVDVNNLIDGVSQVTGSDVHSKDESQNNYIPATSSLMRMVFENKLANCTKKQEASGALNSIMSRVVYVLSGYQNDMRSKLIKLAKEMGAKYKKDWDKTCTHLICHFKNTPKYQLVRNCRGRIVREHWVVECYKHRKMVNWRKYKLGDYMCPESESDENEENSVADPLSSLNRTLGEASSHSSNDTFITQNYSQNDHNNDNP